MLCTEVRNFLSTAKGLPFFYVVGDEDYNSALDDLKLAGLSVIRMSDFCSKEDKFPNIDELVDYLRTADVDYRSNKFVVVGLGEFLALKGSAFADKELRRLKNTTVGNTRAVFLLRSVSMQAISIIKEDSRMIEQQRSFISSNTTSDISVTNITADTNIVSKKGIKYLIKLFEDGNLGNNYASTNLFLEDSLIPVSVISESFGVIKLHVKNLNLVQDYGTEEQWTRLLKDLAKCQNILSNVFAGYNIDESIYNFLHEAISGKEYKNWLVFIYFKYNKDKIANSYMKAVIEATLCFEDLKINLLTLIIKYNHTDERFAKLYSERKSLLKNFPEEEIAIFIKENEADYVESIYRFTDNTLLEKKNIIKWIANHGMTDALPIIYPALNDYLKKYIFDCNTISVNLTEYFEAYKRQKVLNFIEHEFMTLVEESANNYSYTKLKTRNNAIKEIADKDNVYLYWIDALGVEYLSYIRALAQKNGLSMQVDITQCELPTITKINKSFYEQWSGTKKFKEEGLDNIKHKEKGGYFFRDDETGKGDTEPLHLAAELEVIEKAVRTAAYELAMHTCKSFVIASDHGASRLAVIKKQEVPYDTDTKGEHSGRCCKTFEGCDAPYKIEENGYIVLADYGRFRKSRTANVEVHGGASLEEIVVPIITLTLKKQTNIQIQVIHPDGIIADRRNGVTLTVFISDVETSDNISIVIDDKRYVGSTTDGSNFVFELKDVKRVKSTPYVADVFDSFDLIGNISFVVKGKAAKINDDFDFGDDF